MDGKSKCIRTVPFRRDRGGTWRANIQKEGFHPMNGKMIFAGLVAIIMVACTVPFIASEETDALTGHGTHMNYRRLT